MIYHTFCAAELLKLIKQNHNCLWRELWFMHIIAIAFCLADNLVILVVFSLYVGNNAVF